MPKVNDKIRFFSLFLCVAFDKPPDTTDKNGNKITFPIFANVSANGNAKTGELYNYSDRATSTQRTKFKDATGLLNCEQYLVSAKSLKQAKSKLKNIIYSSDFTVVSSQNSNYTYTYSSNKYHVYFKTDSNFSTSSILTSNEISIMPTPESDSSLNTNDIVIVLNPLNITIPIGSSGQMTIIAETINSGLNYQWQINNNGWSNLSNNEYYSGVNTNTLTIHPGNTYDLNNKQFRCVVTNDYGTVTKTSSSATLSVISNSITIINQPSNINIKEGQTTTFSVSANGENLTYQWQYKNSTSNSFQDIKNYNSSYSGITSNNLIINNVQRSLDAYKYRCVIRDFYSHTNISNEALLTVMYIYIQQQPSSVTTLPNNEVSFNIDVDVANGSLEDFNVQYQWFYYKSNSTAQTLIENATTSTLIIPADEVTPELNGYQYGCNIATNTGTFTSSLANLYVNPEPEVVKIEIIKQPKDISIKSGSIGIFIIEANNVDIYQWQANYGDDNWISINDQVYDNGTYIGTDSYQLYVSIPSEVTGWNSTQYRCIVSNITTNEVIISDEVTLTITDANNNTENPEGE